MSGKRSEFKRVLCLVLVCIFVSQLVPASVVAEAITDTQEQAQSADIVIATEAAEPATVVGEVESERAEAVKHYRMSDGSFTAVQYAEPVHYETDSGQWEEIDNTLTLNGAAYTSENGAVTKRFSADLSLGQLFEISYEDYRLSMGVFCLEGMESGSGNISTPLEPRLEAEASVENPTTLSVTGLEAAELTMPAKLSSEISYRNVYSDTDIVYKNDGYNIKESIVVREKQDEYRYAFALEARGLSAFLVSDGSVELRDENNETVFTIPAPYMADADGEVSYAAEYALAETQDGYVLGLAVDKEWMNSSTRAYPVSIDPSVIVTAYSNSSNIAITDLREGSPNDCYGGKGEHLLGYGCSTLVKESRLLLGFDALPELPNNCVMTNAQLMLYEYSPSFAGPSNMILNVMEVTGTKPSEMTYKSWVTSCTWNCKPERSTVVQDYYKAKSTMGSGYITWNITRTAKQWYDGASKTRAVYICVDSPGQYSASNGAVLTVRGNGASNYDIPNRPALLVSYRSTAGLEDYYTYQTVSAARGGTVYVGDYTNQITVVNTDVSYSSEAVTAEISHVYNSAYAGTAKAWKLSVEQTIREETVGDTEYLVYNDADGTDHYFQKTGTNAYTDEDGLGLSVKKNGTSYTMTDRDKYNTWTFTNGFLTERKDSNGNKLSIVCENGKVKTVKAVPNGGAELAVAALTYIGERLTRIVDQHGKSTTYEYDSSGRLTRINYPGGINAHYSYDTGGYISDIYDAESKYGLSVSYRTNGYGGKTLHTITEYSAASHGGTKSNGNSFRAYKPSAQMSNYRYFGANHADDMNNEASGDDIVLRYSFDHSGRTINVSQLNWNESQMLGATSAAYTENSATSGKNNRLTQTGAIGIKTPVEYIDGGFEYLRDKTLTSAAYVTRSNTTNNTVHSGQHAVKLSGSGSAVTAPVTLVSGQQYTFSVYICNYSTAGWSKDSYLQPVLVSSRGSTVQGTKFTQQSSRSIEKGWERISWTFTAGAGGSWSIGIKGVNFTGDVYVDDMQLEKAEGASVLNLVQNGKPTSSARWDDGSTISGKVTYDASANSKFGGGAIKLSGSPSVNVNANQIVYVNDPAETTYILSAWGKATAVGSSAAEYDGESPYFGIVAAIKYMDTAGEEWHMIPFNADYSNWQYAEGVIIPKQNKEISHVRVYLLYTNNSGAAYMDNVSLVREPCSSYSYDDKGNPVSAKEGGAKTNCEYESGTSILTKYTASTGVVTSFTYEATTHNLKTVTSAGVTSTNTHNGMGLVESTTSSGGNQSQKASAGYDEYGRKTSETDVNGVTSTGTYGTNNYLTNTKTGDVEQTYTYNAAGRVATVAMSGAATQSMSYTSAQLSELTRTANSKQQKYQLSYDSFGNMTQLRVSGSGGSQTLAAYEYESGVNNGRLSKLSYGNGAFVQYTYDIFDRITQERYNDGTEYNYKYSTEGQLAEQSSPNEKYVYGYDSLGRLVNSTEYNGGSFEQRTYQAYDASNRLVSQVLKNTGGTTAYTYGYATATGLLQNLSVYLPGNTYNPVGTSNTPSIEISYAYNGLNQLRSKTVGTVYTRAFAYRQLDAQQDRRGDQVAIMNYRSSAGNVIYGDRYYYDSNARLVKVASDTNATRATYGYTNGQLTSATVGGTSYTYTYDGAGNLLSKTDGGTRHSYTYGSSVWADLLTAYDGQSITYDEIGNPESYYNGTRMTMTWAKGRQLAALTKGSTSVSYAYDMAGVRSGKTVGGTSYKYTTLSGLITRQTWGSNYIEFIYDESGQPFAMRYNGTVYYYVLNAQGDVVGLINTSGTLVATYTYDPWGKVISSSGSLADVNPLRYRGYYYDAETGFYYLQSRYYDPAIGRFINADSLLRQGSVLGNNVFTYCLNNPVNMSDTAGTLPFFLITAAIGAVAGAVIGGVVAAKNGGNVWTGIGIGAAAGSLVGAGLGAVAGVMLAGSATASTAAVVSGAGMVATAVSTGGAGTGLELVADNISRAASNVGTVLYSGGEQARQAAMTFANNTGGTTIDFTVIGKVADATAKVPGADFTTVWSRASAAFCNQASGIVNAFVSNSAYRGMDSIFWSVEIPTLLNNHRVTEIVIHIFE